MDEVTSLLSNIRDASEPLTLLRACNAMATSVQDGPRQWTRLHLNPNHRRLLSMALSNVCERLAGAPKSLIERASSFVTKTGIAGICAASHCLGTTTNVKAVDLLLGALETVSIAVSDIDVDADLLQTGPHARQLFEQLFQAPDRINNAARASSWTPTRIIALANRHRDMLASMTVDVIDTTEKKSSSRLAAICVELCVRRGIGSQLARSCLSWAMNMSASHPPKPCRQLARLVEAQLDAHSSKTVTALLVRHASSSSLEGLVCLLAPSAEESCTSQMHRVLRDHVLLASPQSMPTSWCSLAVAGAFLAAPNDLDDCTGVLDVIYTVLSCLSDGTFLAGTPDNQIVRLCEVLTILVAASPTTNLKSHSQDLIIAMLPAVQQLLACNSDSLRRPGLAACQFIANRINPTHSLDFGETAAITDDVQTLAKLQNLSPGFWKSGKATIDLPDTSSTDALIAASVTAESKPVPSNLDSTNLSDPVAEDDSDEDSDDELEPLPEPTREAGRRARQKPRFLRPCLEMLNNKDTPYDQHREALSTLPELIRTSVGDVEEIFPSLALMLLCMENNYSNPDFAANRNEALVALGVACPSRMADFLIENFFAEDFAVPRRLDMLRAMTDIATALSDFRPPSMGEATHNKRPDQAKATAAEEKPSDDNLSANEIIRRRLEAKTRRFHSKPRPKPHATKNRFGEVAGKFFFPLMAKYDQDVRTLQLLGRDTFLLSALIQTLGHLLYCAKMTPSLQRMLIVFMEFAQVAQHHASEGVVRRGLLYGILMAVEASSTSTEAEILLPSMNQLQPWLEAVASSDADTSCRQLSRGIFGAFKRLVTEVWGDELAAS